MNSHTAVWLGVAFATGIIPTIAPGVDFVSPTQFALIVAAAYVAHSQIKRLAWVRRARRVTKAAKAVRKVF